MRHARIYKKARFIDQLVDYYKQGRGRRSFPHKVVHDVVRLLFPGSELSGRGFFKTVHKVSSPARHLVLKTASSRSILWDLRVYKRLPATIRNRYFAKVYWRTKYCLLQKYGKEGKIPTDRLGQLKSIGKRYGLGDIRPVNIRKIDGRFKIVDANLRKRRTS